jgi:hypothetical protein
MGARREPHGLSILGRSDHQPEATITARLLAGRQQRQFGSLRLDPAYDIVKLDESISRKYRPFPRREGPA